MNRGRQRVAGARVKCPLCRTEAPDGFDPATAPTPLVSLMRELFPQRYAQREAQQAEVAALEAAAAPLRLLLRIGNRHEAVQSPQMTKNGRYRNEHRWTMFVENAESRGSFGPCSDMIKNVRFKLTPFFPSDAVLRTPPFCTTKVGWGYFDVTVTVTFKEGISTGALLEDEVRSGLRRRCDKFEVEHELCFEDGGASEVHEVLLFKPSPTATPAAPRRSLTSRVSTPTSLPMRLAGQRSASSQGPREAQGQGTRPIWR